MNIHEHQAKDLLKKFGAPVSKGYVITDSKEIDELKNKLVDNKEYVVKAQIHAGGRGKAGGVKLTKNLSETIEVAKQMLGKILITHQTGPGGKKVKRVYIEESSEILREFYISCLIDRANSTITFISSSEGGMDIEKVAQDNPSNIKKTKLLNFNKISESEYKDILSPFQINGEQFKQGKEIINAMLEVTIKNDATLVEINPLILNKKKNLHCLDAKINIDDNALFRQPEILKLRDLNEEEPSEIEASKYDLAYIKLEGEIGCMVNGAGLAMATMDIIKMYGKEPANFLDVGGGASKEKVSAALKLILADKNVKGILINIFGGIMRCDVLAQGVIDAAREVRLDIPLVVRLAGTNVNEGKKILADSDLKILAANDLNDAAKKIVEAIK